MNNRILQDYIRKLRNLQDSRRTPHKPFLLLIIVEMLACGELSENHIPFEAIEKKKPFFAVLIAVFNSVNGSNWQPNIQTPFFHLKTNGFWHLDPRELQSRPAGVTPRVSELRNRRAVATVDENLFLLLAIPDYRAILRQTLISSYFSEMRDEIERVIAEHRGISCEHIAAHIEAYSQQLIQETQHPFLMQRDVASVQTETPVRRAGFRQAVMRIYDYTCAVCALNIRASSGESVTDAAHIIPFSVSYNDDIRNGMSLCKLHHWAFDAGLISVSETYQVIVSPAMTEHGPTASMLARLRDRQIWLPSGCEYRPAPEALAWHRQTVMRH